MIPSGPAPELRAIGSASTFKRICHPDRSKAQWSDLLFLFWFSHRIVILRAPAFRGRGCDFIDLSREVIEF
jgi:hypothetical protein